ncbi:hypothetical protein [Nocardiopsis ansamitocini]|uniref:Acyl carrier protein n=1 Tax=Nocardiopsis ansamitocini TaxID=1670832 RepID=A0A9W6PAI3_9ACTN|nr:hypothetical protein [Nocardiopsis ansamitocini]GLU50019.1 hypothetical protein Nans01_43700 [Nocardiopsis ansamitocini]
MAVIDRDELVSQIKVQAFTILMFASAEPQIDLPEPTGMTDLDSFAVVQLILTLEDNYDVMLLEEIPSFSGETFEDLADFIIEKAAAKEGEKESGEADTAAAQQ